MLGAGASGLMSQVDKVLGSGIGANHLSSALGLGNMGLFSEMSSDVTSFVSGRREDDLPKLGDPENLPNITLIKNLRLDLNGRRRRSLLGNVMGNMDSAPIDDVTKMFSDFNFPMDDVAGQIDGIQESISSHVRYLSVLIISTVIIITIIIIIIMAHSAV
nr:hypothetical protein BaRGS_031108 [Batillaria attramentaria]